MPEAYASIADIHLLNVAQQQRSTQITNKTSFQHDMLQKTNKNDISNKIQAKKRPNSEVQKKTLIIMRTNAQAILVENPANSRRKY